MRWVVNATPRPLYPRERDQVRIVWEAGWAPGPVWTGAENLGSSGIRSPDRSAHSDSRYRLSYAGLALSNTHRKMRHVHTVHIKCRSYVRKKSVWKCFCGTGVSSRKACFMLRRVCGFIDQSEELRTKLEAVTGSLQVSILNKHNFASKNAAV